MENETRKFKITVSVVLTLTGLWTAFISVAFFTITKLKPIAERMIASEFTLAEFPYNLKMQRMFWAMVRLCMIPAPTC